jgi:hypothetical protein
MDNNLKGFVRELRQLQAALQEMAESGFKERVGQVVEQALRLLGSYMAEYPAPAPNSSYRRTRTLGRLWTVATPRVTVRGHVLEGRIRNATPYARLVQKEGEQRRVHRGRWQTDEDVVSGHVDEVERLLQAAGVALVQDVADSV